jgi:putative membrane-bound dehydrogenase-like protein
MIRRNHHTALAAAILAVLSLSLMLSGAQEQTVPSGSDPAITVPDGFTVERVAGPPLVNRPIVADFDEQGRLYVADSSGSNAKTEQQLIDRPHRIVRLVDKDGDGRYDSSTVFADRMMLPEGTMWFDGSLYVAAPPSIWRLTDTNDDGVADEREEWHQGKTLTGCANDLHGPYLGLDGWIYWTKGAFAQQTWERAGQAPLVTRASHIFRRRPGSTELEPVMTGGMDNPVDVAFTPAGERIFTATFLVHPQAGRRDALVHAVYGGVYGKPHAVIDGHKRTGDLMPVMLQLGPDVPAGLTRYASGAFGDEYKDNLFAAMFNVRKVTRHVLEPSGATFTTRDSDFLVSSSRDFHPTDVIEDADGSLLVVDTGPWYKLCCPSSQLAKPEVFGAIYRVRRTGAPRVSDPRGLQVRWNSLSPPDLARLLDDVRHAVRERALREFAKRGAAAVPALAEVLRNSHAIDARRNAVWALTRIDDAHARAAVRTALRDGDASVRQAAVHSAGLWRDRDALPLLLDALASNVPPVQRAAAEALGRIDHVDAVKPLLAAAANATDRVLEHSLTYALIEIGEPAATTQAAGEAASPRATRAALIALDQMDGGGVAVDTILPLLESSDPLLKETGWWITSRHPEWGGRLAGYVEGRLASPALSTAERQELQDRLVQFSEHAAIQELLGTMLQRAASRSARVSALQAMATIRAKELPRSWVAPLARALRERETEVVRQAVAVARAAPPPQAGSAELRSALMSAARNSAAPPAVRLDALAALPGGLTSIDPDVFSFLLASLGPKAAPAVRVAGAGIIERSRPDADQLLTLADSLERAGPLELPRLLPAFDHAADEAIVRRMLAALEKSKSRASLRPDVLRARLTKFSPDLQKQGEALLASVHADAASQVQRLETMLTSLDGGDVRRGQDIFNSPKAACLTCHAIGYMGGRVGPDLTRIGQIRSERDLLEAILFPNASFARGYEPVTVTTTSGDVHGGVLRSDLRDEIVVATGAGEEIRIARERVKDMQPGTVSLMPAGLDQQLNRQELADLLAFLKATRSGAN